MKRIVLLGIIAVTAFSCKNQHSTVFQRLDNGTGKPETEIYAVSSDASKKGSYFVKTSNGIKFITEPMPDAEIAIDKDIQNKLGYDKLTNDAKLKITEKITELGERTVAVNVLRDALYRLSELKFNNSEIDDKTILLFNKILEVSEKIAIADDKKADAQKTEAEAQKIEAKVKEKEVEIKLKKIDPDAGVRANYQTAIKFIVDKDEKNAVNYFEELYKEFPTHFNIDEINKELKKLSKSDKKDWKSLYNFIVNGHTYRIDDDLVKLLKNEAK